MRIMVIRNEPPWPLCYGGRLRCYELCRRLARRHELLLLAQRPGERADWPFDFECRVARDGRLLDDAPDLAAEGLHASRVERFFGIRLPFVRDVLKVAGQWRPDLVVGMNYQSMACLSRIRTTQTLCDLQDDDALHMLLELWRGHTMGKWQALKTLVAGIAYQWQHCAMVNAVALNSQTDQRFYRSYTGHPRVACVPHGVDCEHYTPQNVTVDTQRIVFWGGLSFGPNITALRFFGRRVWPRIRAAYPRARWTILGPGDAPQLREVRELPGVEWLGYVDDIRSHVARAAAAVVPMLSGAGIKNKIMEAWAMGTPVVCTPRALGDLPGEHGANVWLGRSPARLAAGVLALFEQPELRRRLGQAGRQTALEHCSWDVAAARFEALCSEVVGIAAPLTGAGAPAVGGARRLPV